MYPSQAAALLIKRDDSVGSAENYIVFPPTLVWYNSDKPGEVKNARELILYEEVVSSKGAYANAFRSW